MKKILFSMTLAAITFTACQEQPSYTITGTITKKEAKDATMAYLTEYKDEGIIKLDSAEVKDGKFIFTGRQDSTKYCWLRIYNPKRTVATCNLYLENGDINVIVGEWNEYHVTGSPSNDIQTAHENKKNETYKEEIELTNNFKPLNATEEETANYQKQLKAVKEKRQETIKRLVAKHYEDNIQNAIGLNMFVNNLSFNTTEEFERQKGMLAKLPKKHLNNPKVQKVIKEMEACEKTLAGKPFIDLEMPITDGNTLKLSDVVSKHKYTLVHFWAASFNVDVLKDAYSKYDRKDLGVVGITSCNDEAALKDYLENHEILWPQMIDLKNEGIAQYGFRTNHCYIIIAQDGTIISRNFNFASLTEKLPELLVSHKEIGECRQADRPYRY